LIIKKLNPIKKGKTALLKTVLSLTSIPSKYKNFATTIKGEFRKS
jgi:hypothetical protein